MSLARLVLPIVLLTTTTTLAAQEADAERTQEQATAAFIERKTASQNARAQRSFAPNELRDLNGIVRAVDVVLPDPAAVNDEDQLEAIRNLYLVDIAQGLQTFGFKPGTLRSASDNGEALVGAMGAVLRGTASIDDYIMLADTVFVGRKASEDNETLDDGHGSTIGFEIVREIKIAPNVKDNVDLRRRSGPRPDGHNLRVSNEVPLEDGQLYLIVGSRAQYLNEFSERRNLCKDCVVELIPALVVDGNVATSTAAPAFTVDLNAL